MSIDPQSWSPQSSPPPSWSPQGQSDAQWQPYVAPPAPYQQAPAPYQPPPYSQAGYGPPPAAPLHYAPPHYAAAGYLAYPVLPPLASYGQRLGASIIDRLPTELVVLAGYLYLLLTSGPGFNAYGEPTSVPTPTGLVVLLVAFISSLTFWIWNRVVVQGRTGSSMGKRAVGIRLLSEATMMPPGVGLALGREFAHNVDQVMYIGYLWPLWDAKRQTLADRICSTVVVRDR